MYNLGSLFRKTIIIISIIVVMPISSYGRDAIMSFLPMEDSMSPERNTSGFTDSNIKPYRESFSLGKQKIQSGFSFSNTDILAFILLAGVYVVLVRKNSKPRNINL